MDNPNNMVSLFFFSQILIYFAQLTLAQSFDLSFSCRSDNNNFTNNSTYRTNLDSALSSIASTVNTTIYGFNTTSVGQNPDVAHALALCRGDIDQFTCGECVYNSTIRLQEVCPNRRDATGWHELCMLSYSNSSSLLNNMDDSIAVYMWNTANVTDAEQFNADLRTLLDDLRTQASGGGPQRKFATGNVSGPSFLDIYGLMQCTPNLSSEDCYRCLTGSIADIPNCCSGRRGGRIIKPSCKLRFETTTFFGETPVDVTPPAPAPPPSLQSPPPLPLGENDNRMRTVLITAVPIFLLVLLVAAIWIFISKGKKRKQFEPILDSEP